MPHVDPDVLGLLALGEPVASAQERDHLSTCARCTSELDELAVAATVGRSTLDAGVLADPHARVWDAIRTELGLARDLQPTASTAAVVPGSVAPVDLAERRARRRPRGIALLVAAAAVFATAVGGGVLWQSLRPIGPEVVARASLDAFPAWPGASGDAVVATLADGTREVRVSLDAGDATENGYREVWLITSDATALVSLGVLEGASGTFTIPDGVDIGDYDLVDVSEEPLDGDPQHSGDSIVRGQLA